MECGDSSPLDAKGGDSSPHSTTSGLQPTRLRNISYVIVDWDGRVSHSWFDKLNTNGLSPGLGYSREHIGKGLTTYSYKFYHHNIHLLQTKSDVKIRFFPIYKL